MLYTVSEISELTSLSKVSIYTRLKLKELEPHISKKQGVTYIDEDGFNIIKEGLSFKEEPLNSFKDGIPPKEPQEATTEGPQATFNPIEDDCISVNKELFNALLEQLKEKDKQIKELHKLIENSQVLLRDKPHEDILLLEDHFQALDNKLINIKEQMEQRKKQYEKAQQPKGFFKSMFKR